MFKYPKNIKVLNCRTFTRDIRTKPLRCFVVQKTFCMGEANGEITWVACIFQNSLQGKRHGFWRAVVSGMLNYRGIQTINWNIKNMVWLNQIIIVCSNISFCIWTLHIYGYELLYFRYKISHDLCLVNVSDESFVVQSETLTRNFLFLILTRELYFKIRKFACYNPSISQATTPAWAVASCREGDFWY